MTSLKRVLPIVAVSLVCYIVSFFLPALRLTGQANTQGQQTHMEGIMAFINGFFALFELQFAWLANPLAAAGAVLLICGRHRLALGCSLAALLVAQHTRVVVGTVISGDEGGVTKYLVTSLGPGFYVWCASFLLLAIAALVGHRRRTMPPPLK